MLRSLDTANSASVEDILRAVTDYFLMYKDALGSSTRKKMYGELFLSRMKRTLTDRPWQRCPCKVCQTSKVEVILHRGSNRNKRRGFHNIWWLGEVVRKSQQ